MSNYFEQPKTTSALELDRARLREDFPAFVKTWETMNIAERAAEVTRRNREAAGVKA